MKLSMWMIANLLEPFEPDIQIRPDSPACLRSARLAHATDCIYVQPDGEDCLYSWGSDQIRIQELSTIEGLELLQSLFDSMEDWYDNILHAIVRQDWNRFVELCHVVFRNPILLTDANQCILACSKEYGPDQVDSEWSHIKTYGYASVTAGREMSHAQLSYHFSDRLVHCSFPSGSSLCSSFIAPMLHSAIPVGYLTVLEWNHPLNFGHLQLMELLSGLLMPQLSRINVSPDSPMPFMELLLSGVRLPGEALQGLFTRKGWSLDHVYRVIHMDFLQEPGNPLQYHTTFLTRSLAAIFPEDLCGFHKGKFFLLANDTLLPHDQRKARLDSQLEGTGIRISVSLPFPGMQHLPELRNQALFAMDYGSKFTPSRQYLDFYWYALDYLLRSSYTPEACLVACHPDIYALYRTDEILFGTLWMYLVQDRSITRSISFLHIHKNTLLHRLRRIEELVKYDMDDPYCREYMRLSYKLLERHAGLPSPPDNPFPVPPDWT